ncbi:hypothetical protein ACFPRL_06360 [Pseudoclavibacter helvolus]
MLTAASPPRSATRTAASRMRPLLSGVRFAIIPPCGLTSVRLL